MASLNGQQHQSIAIGVAVSLKTMNTIVVATRNSHKAEEIQTILGPSFNLETLEKHASAPLVIEDAATFEGNAIKKAAVLARWLFDLSHKSSKGSGRLFVLADDSGLEVDALGGAPGVHSARFAGPNLKANAPDDANNAKLLRLLTGVPMEKRTARFRCVLALARISDQALHTPGFSSPACLDTNIPPTFTCQGECEGHILESPRGKGGFGYDPLFIPMGCNQTFAELGPEIKNRLSHRARALAALQNYLSKLEI